MKRLAALTLFCGVLALNPGTAQDQKATRPTAVPPKRALYTVQHGDAPTLAAVLERHFKGEADVVAAPAGSGNAILISGAAGTVPEVVKLLEQLDRKPRAIEVEITIAEVPVKKDGPEPSPADLLKDAVGKAGQRIKLTAVEGQPVTSTTGGSKPYVSGTTMVGGGGGFGKGGGAPPVAQKSFSYQNVGTTVKMTARVVADDSVVVDLNVQDSKVRLPDAGDEALAAAMENNTLTTKLSVPASKAVIAQTIRTEGKGGTTVTVVIVTARVVDDGGVSKQR